MGLVISEERYKELKIEKISKKIIEIFGLETDPEGRKNMLLIRDENKQIVQGIDFTDEVIELTQFFDDELTSLMK